MSPNLNYCRQMTKQFLGLLSVPNLPPLGRVQLSQCVDLASAAQKFLLPEGGRPYDDPEFRAIDENEPLRLPHPIIALEYRRSSNPVFLKPGQDFTGKAIVFVRERDDHISLTCVNFANHAGTWVPYPEVRLPLAGYLVRDQSGVSIMASVEDPSIPRDEYSDEVGALFCFLNVLNCHNIRVEQSRPERALQSAAAKRGALPFDTYHVLTVDAPTAPGALGVGGPHRSPREHLRRGHIRRLEDGRKTWVNATVVAAGRGAGKVTKDYLIRGPRQNDTKTTPLFA